MSQFEIYTAKAFRNEPLTRAEALDVLRVPDGHVEQLLQAVFPVRERHWGRRVKICVLQNARSGLCPEDCHYCSQSTRSTTNIDNYRLLSLDQLLEGARRAVAARAKRYCMVTSGRGPSELEIDHFASAARAIKTEFPHLELCLSLGLMTEGQARQLKAAGIGWINHNLNTSRRLYAQICTTHTYDDRVATIENVRKAGLRTCAGGIIGMGEEPEDIVEMLLHLRALDVDSIPINFLHPIPGTPLESSHYLTPYKGLKALCLARLLNPSKDIRAAGGREVNLQGKQAWALYAANSIFVEGYLTTPGQQAEAAWRMITELGFEIEREEALDPTPA